MVVVWAYSPHLTCLFPQHGEGKKHERPIVLEPWQQELVDAAPWAFLRGCIRSDGCVFINRTGPTSTSATTSRNLSQDILGLFERPASRVGLRPRRYAKRDPALPSGRRRPLLDHVGLKS